MTAPRLSPGTSALPTLQEQAKRCALYDFDSTEMVECKWALWQDIINALGAGVAQGARNPVREALSLAREYISQDHGGFKEGGGYFEQTGEILEKLDSAIALSLPSTPSEPAQAAVDPADAAYYEGYEQARSGLSPHGYSAQSPALATLEAERIALCERLVKYSDDIHCIAVHRDLARDLREAEALITLLANGPATRGVAQAAVDPADAAYYEGYEQARSDLSPHGYSAQTQSSAEDRAVEIVHQAREIYENHEGDGAWIAMEVAYMKLIRAALSSLTSTPGEPAQAPGTSLTNEFHAALVKVHDIARNGTRNTAAWQEVLETVDTALGYSATSTDRGGAK